MLTLYSHPISPNAKRIRVLARELGLDIEIHDLDFGKREQMAPEFLVKNPNGKVPVVEWNGRTLWESPAILYEIASAHPASGLVPEDLAERSEMLRWMFWNVSHLGPALLGVAYETYIKPTFMDQAPDPEKIDSSTRDFEKYAAVLDGHLTGRDWILGDRFSVADITLASTVDVTRVTELSLDPYPAVAAWYGRLTERPSWEA